MSYRNGINFLEQQKMLRDMLRKQRRQELMDLKRTTIMSNSPSPQPEINNQFQQNMNININSNIVNSDHLIQPTNSPTNQLHPIYSNTNNNQLNTPELMLQLLWSNNEAQIVECLQYLKTLFSQSNQPNQMNQMNQINPVTIIKKEIIEQIQSLCKNSITIAIEWLSVIHEILLIENEEIITVFYHSGTIIYLLENVSRIPVNQYDNVYILFTRSMEILTIIFKQYDTVRNDVLQTRFHELLYEVIQSILYSNQPNQALKQLLLKFLISFTIKIPKHLKTIAHRIYDLVSGKLIHENGIIKQDILHIMRNISNEHKQIIDQSLKLGIINHLQNIFIYENEYCREEV